MLLEARTVEVLDRHHEAGPLEPTPALVELHVHRPRHKNTSGEEAGAAVGHEAALISVAQHVAAELARRTWAALEQLRHEHLFDQNAACSVGLGRRRACLGPLNRWRPLDIEHEDGAVRLARPIHSLFASACLHADAASIAVSDPDGALSPSRVHRLAVNRFRKPVAHVGRVASTYSKPFATGSGRILAEHAKAAHLSDLARR